MGLFKKPKPPQMSGNADAYGDLASAREEARRMEDTALPAIQRNAAPAPPAQQNARDIEAAQRMAKQQMAKKRGIQHSIRPLGGQSLLAKTAEKPKKTRFEEIHRDGSTTLALTLTDEECAWSVVILVALFTALCGAYLALRIVQ